VVLIGLLGGLKGAQIASLVAFGKRAERAGPPPEAVSTAVASEQTWEETIESVGSVTAARGVTISNDGPGLVWKIDFESGGTVHEGQTLVELDTRVERAQLASARARQELAETTARRTRGLFASGAIAASQRDSDESALAGITADVDALSAQIERKIVRAPFAGKLGIRLVNVGQYLAAGTPITDLESAESSYVDFALPQQDLPLVAVGMPVRMSAKATDAGTTPVAEGKIFAVEPAVDPTTRNIKLRATVPPDAAALRPGMYVEVTVVLPEKKAVVAVPATAVVHASFGDSVFVVEDEKDASGNVAVGADGKATKTARQQFVRLGRTRGDFAAVVEGVKPGDEVVVGGAFKLRNRTRIAVHNEVELHPELEPHPPNR
jgi:membrane fusion protein (multidrug efflux system)